MIGRAMVFAALGTGFAAAAPPQATVVFPAGAPPGATADVVVSGSFPRWPVGVWTDRGQLVWTCGAEPGRFEVAVPAAGAFGIHRVRFHDAEGASAVRRFLVDPVPARREIEPNDAPRAAMPVELPVAIDGVIDKAGQVDCFRIDLRRGERLVAAVDAHQRLASPFDPGLDLVDDRGALVARDLDAAGLDPQIVHVAGRDGAVVVRVFGLPATPDSTIGLAGGEAFVYRLVLATGPLLTGCAPGALAAGADAPAARGIGVSAEPVEISSVGRGPGGEPVRTASLPGAVGLVELPIVTGAVVEAGAWPLDVPRGTLPVEVTGCLERDGEGRGVRFAAAKGVPLQIACLARSAGSAADPVVMIFDAAGRRLHLHDSPEERFSWQPPADGDYQLVVGDRRDQGSPWHAFRVAIEPPRPAVSLTIATDAVAGTVGKPIAVEVAIERRHGFTERLTIAPDGLPAGVAAAAVVSPGEGDAAKKVVLEVVCHEPVSGPVRIVARRDGGPGGEPLASAACGTERVVGLWLTAVPAVP
ncbi:MAG: hypothetical protein ACKOCW_10160 [Planctomycetaceae bacterium]